jgi:hypothetical protein
LGWVGLGWAGLGWVARVAEDVVQGHTTLSVHYAMFGWVPTQRHDAKVEHADVVCGGCSGGGGGGGHVQLRRWRWWQ